ncbi:MAG: Anthranilate 1,2-dioxygenase large subunit [Candidatus Heimdallarchaeota archaeon LC_2]|nr:MAG: Anthranilate 1,2-dioxygenase large subunit [Candidatus Heimdallarchaeota archaeon LC_2]
MENEDLSIKDNITEASTIPSDFYFENHFYDKSKNKIFAKTWQFITDTDNVRVPGQVFPHVLLEGCLDEPILLSRDFDDDVHCLSNICTHRGFLLIENESNIRQIRCRYHGRKFKLDGKFESMPEFELVKNFPTEADNLTKVNFNIWGKFIFASIDPKYNFDIFIREMEKRVGWLPLNEFRFDSSRSKDYLVHANWALYCDNYLEGFHIPYVHPSLNEVLDYGDYETEIYDYCNLQLGIAEGAEDIFDLPLNHPDTGRRIAAYYYWLFPNTMFNFYPWGLSINIINPLGPERTKIKFLTYVWKPELLDKGAGSGLDRVEREDEEVVELVQKGVKSRFYNSGRFSPTREQGVHHFHKLLSQFMND